MRKIRGHTQNYGGVAHAYPAQRADRYCSACHGVGLQGGQEIVTALGTKTSALAPSCFTCHGQKWMKLDATFSLAPSDHTDEKFLISRDAKEDDRSISPHYRHHPGLFSPEANCAECHGPNLEGDPAGEGMRPSCELCHEKLWLNSLN